MLGLSHRSQACQSIMNTAQQTAAASTYPHITNFIGSIMVMKSTTRKLLCPVLRGRAFLVLSHRLVLNLIQVDPRGDEPEVAAEGTESNSLRRRAEACSSIPFECDVSSLIRVAGRCSGLSPRQLDFKAIGYPKAARK